MNAQDLVVGFVPLARTTFDLPLANQVTHQARVMLMDAGFTLVGPNDLVTDLTATQEAARLLLSDELPDLLIMFQATFADSTMVMALAEEIDVPLLLWAIPETPDGGRLRLNSLCGINLGGHALKRAGYLYETHYGSPNDASIVPGIVNLASAGRVRRLLQVTQIGRIGEHPPGFDTCAVNYEGLQEDFGVSIVQYDLPEIFEIARGINPAAVDAVKDDLRPKLDEFDTVDQTALNGTLSTYVALRNLAERENLTGYAVRCWGDFFTELGCAACGASSLLNDELTPASCEADVNGTITQLMLQWLSGEPAFDTDIVNFDLAADTAVLWHCGKAPLSMCDPAVKPRATIHSNRQLPLLMEFPLKPGRVTLARLSEATGTFRLVVGGGEMLQVPISFTGTSGVVRFDSGAQHTLDVLLDEGLEHHLALTYGDHVEALLALAKMLDLPVLRI